MTAISGSPSKSRCDDHHQLDLARHARPDLVRPAEHLLEHLQRVEVDAVGDEARPRVEAQVEADRRRRRTRGRSRGRPRRGPGGCSASARTSSPVGGDDVDRLDAHAGRPVDPPVPAVTALQQVTAEPDPGAVAGGEEEVVLGQPREQRRRRGSRARRRRSSPRRPPRESRRERSSSRPPSRRWFPAQLRPPERTPTRILLAPGPPHRRDHVGLARPGRSGRGSAPACGRSRPPPAAPPRTRPPHVDTHAPWGVILQM